MSNKSNTKANSHAIVLKQAEIAHTAEIAWMRVETKDSAQKQRELVCLRG